MSPFVAAIDPDVARQDARDILGDRRFQHDPAPRPLRGVLRWIGDRLEPVRDAVESVIGALPWYAWLVIVIALAALVIAYVVPEARRRWQSQPATTRPNTRATDEDPDALEREATDAERAGDYERAVRLRFRAGLLRLGARGAIEYRSSVTVGEVRQALRSSDFEDLAVTFEEVTYSDREAEPTDAEASRQGWPRVLQGPRR